MQSSQVNVTSQIHCLTEELSVIQMAKDQVCVVFVMLLLSINLFSTVSCFLFKLAHWVHVFMSLSFVGFRPYLI